MKKSKSAVTSGSIGESWQRKKRAWYCNTMAVPGLCTHSTREKARACRARAHRQVVVEQIVKENKQ